MTNDKLKDFEEKKKKLMNLHDTTKETIKLKEENIRKEKKTISHLQTQYRRTEYLIDMYHDFPEESLEDMDDYEYASLASPLENVTTSCDATFNLYDETLKNMSRYNDHLNISEVLDMVTLSGSSSVASLYKSNPDWFPHGQEITDKYKIEDKLYEQIEHIKDELKSSFSQISGDFETFIQKINPPNFDPSQYQDLIGSRSMFFFKMIFDFAERSYGPTGTRRDQIGKFVFGSATPIAIADPIINECCEIWKELSSQDNSGPSVKLGNVNTVYIESLFRRLINSITTILELRKRYFKS